MACSPGDNKAVSVVVNPVAGLTAGAAACTCGVGVSTMSGVTGCVSTLGAFCGNIDLASLCLSGCGLSSKSLNF